MKWEFKNAEFSILVGRKEEPKLSESYNQEVDILNNFIDAYLCDYKDKITIVSNTSDYTTLQYDEMDLIRLKYSDKTKWITIFIAPSIKKEYIDNPLFNSQKNKNQLHWKSIISDKSDLSNFNDICIKDIEFWTK